MSFYPATYQSRTRVLHHTRRNFHAQKTEVKSYLIIFFIIFLVGVICFIYLSYFNRIATKGYHLKKLEIEREELMNTKEVNNMQLSQVKALDYIRSSEKVKNMVRTNNVLYLRGDTVLAKK